MQQPVRSWRHARLASPIPTLLRRQVQIIPDACVGRGEGEPRMGMGGGGQNGSWLEVHLICP